MMKLLLLGSNGQVGWELQRSLSILGEVNSCSRAECDLEKLDHLQSMLESCPVDVIVNAAAYTAVDKAESEPERAFRVNAEAVYVIAQHAKKRGALLIHYSTDYVFDGTKQTPYTEDDIPNPINVYGKSKLAGEEAIRASGCRHIIFRTSWVYGHHGRNFAKAILHLAALGESLRVVVDERGAPTSAALIADVTVHSIKNRYSVQNVKNTYNICSRGVVSRYEYANRLVEAAISRAVLSDAVDIEPVNALLQGAAAQRPANSELDTTRIQNDFGLKLPHWQSSLNEFIEQLRLAEHESESQPST
jgi:dTDP-4-dehydrorhamnose reductase